ncbi:beta strand repeat-containing protein, partial [Paraburkholderia sp. BR14261]
MLKKILTFVTLACLAVSQLALAQFVPGQILTATQLNAALASPHITGGTISGLSTPVPLASGGTGATTALGATAALQYQNAASGSTSRAVSAKLGDLVSVLDFGADPTHTKDSASAFAAWYAYLLSTGKAGYIPAGNYQIASSVTWDQATVRTRGVKIYGDGPQSHLDLTSIGSGIPFQVLDSGNTGCFYTVLEDFSIETNVNGPGVVLGQESNADALNAFRISLVINNDNTGSSATAAELNYVVNSNIYIVANVEGPSAGEALRMRQAQFNYIGGSFSNALTGLHLTAGYNYGNIFLAPDIEVVGTAVSIDTATAVHNTMLGGTLVWNTVAINATAGNANRFVGVNFGSGSGVPTNGTGVIIDDIGYGAYPIGVANPNTGNFTSLGAASLNVTGSTTLAGLTASGVVSVNSLSTSSATIRGGTIDGTPIGATTASTGSFTTLAASGAASLGSLSSANATITGGSINGAPIGATAASTGAFTTLAASGAATLNTLASSGVTITGGTINGATIGGTTPQNGSFTTAYLTRPVGTDRDVVFQSAGSTRWQLRVPGTAESGSNVGSDFSVDRFSDTGTFLGSPLTITRASGLVTIGSLGSSGVAITGGAINGTPV